MYKSECEAKVVNQKTPSRWSHVALLGALACLT